MSENGWTDDFLCTKWFEDIFIPQTKQHNIEHSTLNNPILLIYDGHRSHLTDKMLQLAKENNIELFQPPTNTTHHPQPLDVGIFSPLQWKWIERCDDILESTGQEIHTVDSIREYMEVCKQALTKDTIKTAWQKCGIHPFNCDKFTTQDFATSHSSSTKSHAPISYLGYLQGEESDGDEDKSEDEPDDELDDESDSSQVGDDGNKESSNEDAPIVQQPIHHTPNILICHAATQTHLLCFPLQTIPIPSYHGQHIIR